MLIVQGWMGMKWHKAASYADILKKIKNTALVLKGIQVWGLGFVIISSKQWFVCYCFIIAFFLYKGRDRKVQNNDDNYKFNDKNNLASGWEIQFQRPAYSWSFQLGKSF